MDSLAPILNTAVVIFDESYLIYVIIGIVVCFLLVELLKINEHLKKAIDIILISISTMLSSYTTYFITPKELIYKDQGFHSLSHGVKIKLVDAVSFKGWGEGEILLGSSNLAQSDHGDINYNKNLIDAKKNVGRVLTIVKSTTTADEFLKFDQSSYNNFLSSLNSNKRLFGRVSWALVIVRCEDKELTYTLFKGDEFECKQPNGIKKSFLLGDVFNVEEKAFGAVEAITVRNN